jgi:hypothetical protein
LGDYSQVDVLYTRYKLVHFGATHQAAAAVAGEDAIVGMFKVGRIFIS